jgi:hypothetical protein
MEDKIMSKNLLHNKYTLNVPQRYEKLFRVSSSVKGKSLPTHPSGRVGNVIEG